MRPQQARQSSQNRNIGFLPSKRPRKDADSASRHRLSTGGFALLEMLVVIAIITSVLSLAMIRFERVQTRAREVALKQDLSVIRKAIELYKLEKQTPPQSLADLVSAECLNEIPVDPFTRQRDWHLDAGGSAGIVDVHSTSNAVSSEGTAYSAW
jgi:general secretion pathway protein G